MIRFANYFSDDQRPKPNHQKNQALRNRSCVRGSLMRLSCPIVLHLFTVVHLVAKEKFHSRGWSARSDFSVRSVALRCNLTQRKSARGHASPDHPRDCHYLCCCRRNSQRSSRVARGTRTNDTDEKVRLKRERRTNEEEEKATSWMDGDAEEDQQ